MEYERVFVFDPSYGIQNRSQEDAAVPTITELESANGEQLRVIKSPSQPISVNFDGDAVITDSALLPTEDGDFCLPKFNTIGCEESMKLKKPKK